MWYTAEMASGGMRTTFYDDRFRHSTEVIYYLNNLRLFSVAVTDRRDVLSMQLRWPQVA
jgi:hypothetical protein